MRMIAAYAFFFLLIVCITALLSYDMPYMRVVIVLLLTCLLNYAYYAIKGH